MKRNPVGWFEIPVVDMERAIHFYQTVFAISLERHSLGELDMAWFPMSEDAPGSTGSLVKQKAYVPSQTGVLLYFSAQSGDLSEELSRVEDGGGNVLQEKKPIGEYGFAAIILDSEGNRIAIHSSK